MKDDDLKVDAGTGRAPRREELAAVDDEDEEGCSSGADVRMTGAGAAAEV
jgi:hypothetical protein